MSDPSIRSALSLSPWWGLLLLPIALGFGWFMGHLPVPAAVAPKESNARPAIVDVEPPNEPATSARGGEVAARPAQPAPAEPAREAPKPPSTEYSQWTTFDNATAESRRNGKPVLLDFNAEWCPPCQRLKGEVFDDYSRRDVVQTTVIPVSIVDRNVEDGRNSPETESLRRRFGVDAFPTLVVFSPQTGRAVQTKGYRGAEWTLEWITNAARDVR